MDCSEVRDQMLDVLYGEADAETRRRVEEHHAHCPACRHELEALRGVRRALARWQLPERRPVHGFRFGWLAAAAVLLVSLGAALGLSGSEVRFENGRFAFRLGRSDIESRLAEQEARHRTEMAHLRSELATRDNLLAEVDQRLRVSEARQAALLSAGLSELTARNEAQRRYDLARISASLSYLDGRTGQQLARQTELMGYLLQASDQK